MGQLKTQSSRLRYPTVPNAESDVDSVNTTGGYGFSHGVSRVPLPHPRLHAADSQDEMEARGDLSEPGLEGDGTDESEGEAEDLALMGAGHRANLIERCRERYASPWLYFPHVELVFLFFAFEGAVASQASAINSVGCPGMVLAACLALVSPAQPEQRASDSGYRAPRAVGAGLPIVAGFSPGVALPRGFHQPRVRCS